MKPIITKFNDKTGDFEITIPVPFSLKDGIEYVDMAVADIPKYEDIKDYNVFDLIRENQELKKQLDELQAVYNNMFKCHCNRVQVETLLSQQKEFIEYLENEINEIKEQIKNYDIWHEVGTDINFLILKKQFNIEILSKYKEIIGVKDE